MDDLSSVEWTAPKAANQQYPQAPGNYYPTLRPTPPVSGRSTPSTLQPSQKRSNSIPARSNSSTPANDSFANLVKLNASQGTKGLSLQDQQKRLQEEKSKQEADRRKAFDAQYGTTHAASWDSLGDGRTTPYRITSPPTYSATQEYGSQKLSQTINRPFAGVPTGSCLKTAEEGKQDEDDLLAAFDASAPVDKSSHMPDASKSVSVDYPNQRIGRRGMGMDSSNRIVKETNGIYMENIDDNDDPFGLAVSMTTSRKPSSSRNNANGADVDDDDVLGLLGRPVSEFPKQQSTETAIPTLTKEVETHPQGRAIAELVDMGFAPDKSRIALEATESGTDVQAAVGWLLNQAHKESRNNTHKPARRDERKGSSDNSQPKRTPGRRRSSPSGTAQPAWMRDRGLPNPSQSRTESRPPMDGEKDPSQYASDIGNKVFKTAGSLWKTGTKKLNQAVQEFNSDSDSSQPKWMRDAQADGLRKSRPQHRENDTNDDEKKERKAERTPVAPIVNSNVTDEALMLEADSRPLPKKTRAKPNPPPDMSDHSREQPSTFILKSREQGPSHPKTMQQVPTRDPKGKLSRQAVEEETFEAYISPARRKRLTPKPTSPVPEPDMLFQPSKPSFQPNTLRSSSNPQLRIPPSNSLPSRPAPPKRNFPPLSSFALQASAKGRQDGNSAFKRGDYAQATSDYSTSLSAIAPTHPLAIVLLTNRALSHSKTGDPKASMADAKAALDLIGLSRGVGETIDLGDNEGTKPMGIYWEKAMTRQAEALEHMEKWLEAGITWRSIVEAGVGGATSIAGKVRCEKAAAPPSQAKLSAPKKSALDQRPKATVLGDLAPDSESVTRLRAANAAADRLDDEKFALADVVDQRISRWRAGKEGNLRALLSTLENVLWEDSGWKKVGMGDVLLPGKVKLVYMKGIAKVHPDKLPVTATTEQKMISAAVFATLNESWERFKTENGL